MNATPPDVGTPAEARELAEEEFYASLTQRNRGLVPADLQDRIRHAPLLIAGCGSIGGATVQPLGRMGYRDFVLADVGTYELNNLNRQHATVDDLGRNKAEVGAAALRAINPHVRAEVVPEGITPENVRELVRRAEVIVDGVDVTTRSGLLAKVALHQEACRQRKPLVTGWDMAGMLAAQCFDYRLVRRIFDGQLLAEDAERLGTWEVIFRIAPRGHIPGEMYRELRRGLGRPDYSVPQLTEAATQFGSLAVHMVNQLVAGEDVPRTVAVDVHHIALTPGRRAVNRVSRHWEKARFLRKLPPEQAWRGFAPGAVYRAARRTDRVA
ncbi:HesA/MoeB/ThiF family protein [Streptomyces sp. NPDC053513]|uniref:HesA/MoeB/ThiF family protein n=1 Tax=Streptomyces litmocidini TaxID=67318 RepID=A0ABW7U3A3_9ACTN|nr:ThiF family adenylyltransferase [Streptomyces sp. PanSC19]ROQ32497.1 ThiF family protein [Streptomyces sp. PanSC19]